MTTRRAGLILTLSIMALGSSSGAAQDAGATAARIEQQVLLTGGGGGAFVMSPKGEHLAAVVLRGSRSVVVYDGVDGPNFDEVASGANGTNVVFSSDGAHYGYVGRQGQEYVVMVDGKELARGSPWMVPGLPYKSVDVFDFAPAGSHFWYVIHSATGGIRPTWQMHVDAQPAEQASSDVVMPVFSPDGKHHAYVAAVRTGGTTHQALIVDGKPASYLGGNPQWTTDGLHLFTSVPVPRMNAVDVLVDGKPFMRAANVQLHMAPIGSAVAAVVGVQGPNGAQNFLTIGNKKMAGSDCTNIQGVFFSGDGKHIAMTCQSTPTDYWVWTDGKKGQSYQNVSSVLFATDGRAVYQASMNGKTFVVVGDHESDAYQGIVPYPTSKADQDEQRAHPVPAVVVGNHVGYVAMPTPAMGNNRFIVVDGKSVAAPAASDLRFSPDGSHYAYVTNAGVAEDGVLLAGLGSGAMSTDFRKLAFSADGKHLAFPAFPAPDNSKHGMAIDGKYFPTDGMLPSGATFTPDGKHLFWRGRSLTAPRELIYLDGTKVLEIDQSTSLENDADVYWSMGSDGVLTLVGQDGNAMKRYRITPGNSTLDGMVARAK
ncbi:MAG: hypothetical protein ACREND_09365 [Gemmatimonadaceae bacterium]